MKSLSPVRLPATPWTAAYQAPPFLGFSRDEYWRGLVPSGSFSPPCWGLTRSLTCYLQLPGRFPSEVAGEEAAPIRTLVGRDHVVEPQSHAAVCDIVRDELGPVLELLHLPAIELLLLPVQVHHVRGLAPEPEDLHVLSVPVW